MAVRRPDPPSPTTAMMINVGLYLLRTTAIVLDDDVSRRMTNRALWHQSLRTTKTVNSGTNTGPAHTLPAPINSPFQASSLYLHCHSIVTLIIEGPTVFMLP